MTAPTEQPQQQRALSIRYAIPGLFGIMIVAAIGVTGILGFNSGQQAVADLATRLSEEVASRIEEHVLTFVETPHLFHEVNLAAVEAGNLDLEDYAQVERVFWHQVYINEAVPYVYMGTETGDFLGVDKSFGEGETVFKIRDETSAPDRVTYSLDDQGNRVEEIKRSEYDPRVRPWYQAAVEAGQGTWSSIYVFSAAPILGISPVTPVYNENGDLFGVLGIDLTLSELTDFLRATEISPTGEAVIIERTGELVATSTDELPFIDTDEGEKRITMLESEHPLVQATAEHLIERFGSFDDLSTTDVLTFELNGERQFVRVVSIQDGRGLDWLAVVILPANDFMGPVNDNVNATLLIGLSVLVFATLVGIMMARGIIRPVLTIIGVAESIEEGHYEVQPLDRLVGRTDELGLMARVFKDMAEEVYLREQRLKQQVTALKIQIDERKREEQVSEIVETDFFADLQAKARNMRKRKNQPDEEAEEE